MSASRVPAFPYRFEGEKACIEIRLSRAAQLFDVRDPAPFREKDLDDDAVDYIMAAVHEVGRSHDLKIVIHVAEPESDGLNEELIRKAIQNYFSLQEIFTRQRIQNTLRQGRLALTIGLAVLTVFMGLSYWVRSRHPEALWTALLAEGLNIAGWVALWHPLELLLYSWWPMLRQRRVYSDLSRVDVELFSNHSKTPSAL